MFLVMLSQSKSAAVQSDVCLANSVLLNGRCSVSTTTENAAGGGFASTDRAAITAAAAAAKARVARARVPSALTDRSGLNTSAPVGAMRTAKANLASDIHLWSGVLVPKAQSQHGCACFFCVHSAAFSVDPRCAGVRFVIIGQNSRVQWVAGIKKTGHEETTPSDFRKNLRNHGGPQARPREKARHESRV